MKTNGLAQSKPAALGSILRRERSLVLAAVLVITLLAWAYLARLALHMESMSLENAMQASWDFAYFLSMFVMWAVMMVAMMLHGASPVILLYAAIQRRPTDRPGWHGTALFVSGYLAIWFAFSLTAVIAQWVLSEAALLSPMMMSTSAALTGVLFLAAGIYQLTPLKNACLANCRSPVEFLTRRPIRGAAGALRRGLEHGLYCLGCCWMLMALLFALGVMNLVWIAALSILVLMEKLFPSGPWLARAGGLLLAAIGVVLLATG